MAEAIPFAALTQYDVPALYALKGEIVRRGVKAIAGFDMPVFPKRRFQHGAMPVDVAARPHRTGRERLPAQLPRPLRQRVTPARDGPRLQAPQVTSVSAQSQSGSDALSGGARDRFVLDRRQPRPHHDPWRHQGVIVEDERGPAGRIAGTATVLLTGRECPWRCTMCDLWRFTTAEDTPRGAIPAQVAAARAELQARPDRITQMKLYNAGSFFDPRAVPEADYDDVAAQLGGLERVVVESHPALVGPAVDRLLEALDRQAARGLSPVRLEVAMGLETAHAGALDRLNKRMTVETFADAAGQLRRRGAALRVFLLIAPPFIPSDEQPAWLLRSIDVAFACGASVVSLIPTRPGNGALETLAVEGAFRAPCLEDVERSIASALAVHPVRGRIFVDLWNLEQFSRCSRCFDARRDRLHAMNLEQRVLPPAPCAACGSGGRA